METAVRTPMSIFHMPQRLEIPLFQRPYVWDEADQWLPLWQDVRRVAELRLNDPASTAAHFLGAVVVQAGGNVIPGLQTHNVIDGQQRLTTLQLLTDAAAAVMEEAEADGLAAQLEFITHNSAVHASDGQSRLKVQHSNRDREAYVEVMRAEPPVNYAALRHAGSLIARAHQFFAGAVADWLGDTDVSEFGPRAEALVAVLTNGLQLVVIGLKADENSQEIFETLNARGTPLTASDLIKNFVFQKLESEGADVRRAYAEDWPFESKFWDTEISVGRYPITRGSLFLNQWLVSRTGEEISPKSTFSRFKIFVEHEAGQKMSDLLAVLKQQADRYEHWTEAAADPDRTLSPAELAVYRMKASGVELLTPLLIWLHEPGMGIPINVANKVIAATESWLYRRQLLRLPSGNLGSVIEEIIRIHRSVPSDQLPGRVIDYLTGLSATSNYWPGDDEMRRMLGAEPAYRRYPRGRLRMFLETVEDYFRAPTNQPRVPRRGYPIEHVLPQKWQSHWNVEMLEAQLDRAAHVHRFGNLTLLTEALNSSVSNGPWHGPNGKRAKLAKHDVFLMNRLFHDGSTETWDEKAIDARTNVLVDALIATWPVPPGHMGAVTDANAKDTTWIELKHLIAAGLIQPGCRLTPRQGKWADTQAFVTEDGQVDVGGVRFQTPSGAGRHVKGGHTNGWYFWRVDDGRRLVDVRAAYRGEKPVDEPFDWSRLHQILEALPEGHWTTYGDLADAVGTAAVPLGSHIKNCERCINAHRVLSGNGRFAKDFTWTDPTDSRDPRAMLESEGVSFTGTGADPAKRLSSDELAVLADGQ